MTQGGDEIGDEAAHQLVYWQLRATALGTGCADLVRPRGDSTASRACSGWHVGRMSTAMLSHRTSAPPLLTVVLAFASACSDGTSPDTGSGGGTSHTSSSSTGGHDAGTGGDAGPLGVSCSGAAPTFSGDVEPILRGCSGEGCHLWTSDQLVDVPVSRDTCDPTALLVVPGDLEKSYLMNKLTGIGMCPQTAQMRSYGNLLPARDVQTIADWICQGAKNN
jgi:hypothetical protein